MILEVIDDRTKKIFKVEELEKGDTFIYNGQVYLLLDRLGVEKQAQVINLSDGADYKDYIDYGTIVENCDIKIKIVR